MKAKEHQKQFNPHVQDKMPHCVWMTGNPSKGTKNQRGETLGRCTKVDTEETIITIELSLYQVIGLVLIVSAIIDLIANY